MQNNKLLKAATTKIKYFAGNKFFGSLVHKKNCGLILTIVFKLGYLFYQER